MLGDKQFEAELEQLEHVRLKFDSHDDVLDYARKTVEESNHWLAVHKLDIVNRYIRNEVEIHVKCTSRLNATKFHFVFNSIPSGARKHCITAKSQVCAGEIASGRSEGAYDHVFVGVTDSVQYPQQVIPSFVCLERAHEVTDFFGQVFASSFYRRFKVSSVVGNWEGGIGGGAEGVNSFVEGGAQINDGITKDVFQVGWHGLNEFDLINFLGSFRVSLNDSGVWLTREELVDLPFKVTDVILCPCNLSL
jgi:hypothetical protein